MAFFEVDSGHSSGGDLSAIYNAIVEQGVTPSSYSVEDIVTAIAQIIPNRKYRISANLTTNARLNKAGSIATGTAKIHIDIMGNTIIGKAVDSQGWATRTSGTQTAEGYVSAIPSASCVEL